MEILPLSEGAVTGDVRIWLRAEGLAAFALSLIVYWRLGASWWIFVGLFLAPDLFMLGYLISSRAGAASYNVVHSYLLPLGLAVFAIATNRMGVLPLVCIWSGHIGLDRVLGYGLKYPAGFRYTHFGILGGMAG